MPEIVEVTLKIEIPDNVTPELKKEQIKDLSGSVFKAPLILVEVDPQFTIDQVLEINEYAKQTWGRKD